jgi:hypothetical protein
VGTIARKMLNVQTQRSHDHTEIRSSGAGRRDRVASIFLLAGVLGFWGLVLGMDLFVRIFDRVQIVAR